MQLCTLAAIFLGLCAFAASAEIERNGVLYDEYDEGIEEDDSSETSYEDTKRERRQAELNPSWMGAPFLHATCRLQPSEGSNVQGYLYIFQKRPWDNVKVKGSIWGMVERKERFEVGFHANAPDVVGNCDSAGDTLMEATGIYGSLGVIKARGYGRPTGISRGNKLVTLEKGNSNSVVDRSIVVTSLASRKRVACCSILQQ